MTLDDLGRLIEQLPFASIDHLRPTTQGHQEVIFCPGKTPGQVAAIAERLEVAGGQFLATRADAAFIPTPTATPQEVLMIEHFSEIVQSGDSTARQAPAQHRPDCRRRSRHQ